MVRIELTERELAVLIDCMKDICEMDRDAMKDEPEGSVDYADYKAAYDEDTALVDKLSSYRN